MKSLKSYLRIILEDLWGIILMQMLSVLLRRKGSGSSVLDILSPSKFMKSLKCWTENSEADEIKVIHVGLTSFFLIFLLSALLSSVFFALHLLYPFLAKIASGIALPFSVYYFFETTEISRYRIVLYMGAIAFSLYRIYTTCMFHDSLAYDMSSEFIDKIFRQPLSFYICVLIQYFMIFVDTIIIRFADLAPDTFFKAIVFPFYMISFVNIASYSIRASLTMHHGERRIPGFREISFMDRVAAYFNSRALSLARNLQYLLSVFDSAVYRPFFLAGSEDISPYEENRAASFFCSISGCSLIKGYIKSRDRVWHGELRRRMRLINLREDMLPAALISFSIVLSATFAGPENLIRAQEAFVVLFSHFFIVVEVFYTYIFVELYKTTYGLGEKIQKTVKVKKSVSDDVLTSNIDVNER